MRAKVRIGIVATLLVSVVSGVQSQEMVTRFLSQMDANKDGKLAKSEATGPMARFFSQNDTNSDGFLSHEELTALEKRLLDRRKSKGPNPGRNPGGMTAAKLLESAPDDVTIEADIAYREGSNACKLDLVMPKVAADKPRPGIVFVHGGGWRSGDKRAGTFLSGAIEYAQKGYVCITINYRLVNEAPFPACIEDVKCAVRWFRENAEKYNLDPDRIGAYGNSAGAHLVSMLGLAKTEAGLEGDGPYQEQSSLVQAVCASATPTDFSLFSGPKHENRFASEKYEADELSRLSSPITHVSKDAPPFLLIHGTADTTVHVKHSDTFVEALKKAGNEDVTYIRIEGAGHGVFNQEKEKTHPAMAEFFSRTIGKQ